MFMNLLLPYNLFLVWKQFNISFLFIIVVTCSNTLLISSSCSYSQLQLCVGPRGMVLGEVKQSTIYAKFGESSCKKVFKTKDHTMIDWAGWRHKYNITVREGAAFSARARGGRLCSYATAVIQSDCLYSSLFFEHYNRILHCEWVIELSSVRLIDGVSSHNAFAFYLDSTNLGISALLRSSAVTSVTC